MSYYVEIRKLLFLLYSCLCLFQISLNINTFKQQQKKTFSPVISSLISPSSLCPEPIHRHLRFSPLRGDENSDWSAFPAGNERASLGGLFKQSYRVVPGQPFTWRPNCVAYSSRRESYFPTRSWSPRCSLHASSWMYKETWVYSLYVLRLLLCCLCTHRQFVLLNLPKTSGSLIWKIIL